MADIQSHLLAFHDAIKLGHFDENETLRTKRDAVLKKLAQGLQRLRDEEGLTIPTYESFHQGSYAMRTGVKPLDSDYDIDVGISFKLKKDDYEDAVEVKEWVHRALEGHTKKVVVRRPCVTVFYTLDDEPQYHVDLAIYSDSTMNADGHHYLAKGMLESSADKRIWEISSPQLLVDMLADLHKGDDGQQFRRIIRYLKRWKDVQFKEGGNAAPRGIALTSAAYRWFEVKKVTDFFTNESEYDDVAALAILVDRMISNFVTKYDPEKDEHTSRLSVPLPVPPGSDPFEKMTDRQMGVFKENLESLKKTLRFAKEDPDEHAACTKMHEIFGDDFPVPDKSDTADRVKRGIASSSESA